MVDLIIYLLVVWIGPLVLNGLILYSYLFILWRKQNEGRHENLEIIFREAKRIDKVGLGFYDGLTCLKWWLFFPFISLIGLLITIGSFLYYYCPCSDRWIRDIINWVLKKIRV